MDKNKIEIKDLYLIFGSERNKAFKMLKKGKSKSELLKETGCTVAVNNASLSVREGEIFVIILTRAFCPCSTAERGAGGAVRRRSDGG